MASMTSDRILVHLTVICQVRAEIAYHSEDGTERIHGPRVGVLKVRRVRQIVG